MHFRESFRRLHDEAFIIPNPWDIGSARLFAALGFQALATTAAGPRSRSRPSGYRRKSETVGPRMPPFERADPERSPSCVFRSPSRCATSATT